MYQNYMNQYPNDTEVTMPAFVNKNTGIDTDWQDAMLRSGVSQNYMFSIRGGSKTPSIHSPTIMPTKRNFSR